MQTVEQTIWLVWENIGIYGDEHYILRGMYTSLPFAKLGRRRLRCSNRRADRCPTLCVQSAALNKTLDGKVPSQYEPYLSQQKGISRVQTS